MVPPPSAWQGCWRCSCTRRRLEDGQLQAFLSGSTPLPADRRQSVLADLRAAEALRPGTDALLGQALAAAERLARRAVIRGPENFAAHLALAAALAGSDPQAARREGALARKLNPLIRP